MPYIKQAERTIGTEILPANAGELNYSITMLALEYLKRKGMSYANINEIVGAMECAKAEFYRRVAVPYERTKIDENGDLPLFTELGRPS